MDLGLFASLFLLTFLNAAVPGPGIIFVTGVAARFGGLRAAHVVAGMLLGTALLFTAAMAATLGVFSLGNEILTMAQWVGVGVLVFLAWHLWPSGTSESEQLPDIRTRHFWTGVVLSLSQPMSLVFLLAVVPQFAMGDIFVIPQMFGLALAVLSGTGLAMAVAAAFGQVLAQCISRLRVGLTKVASVSLVLFACLSALSALGLIRVGAV